jgi:hypothetical protein
MESNKKKLNTPVKENFCKNLFQTPKSYQNEGNDFENDEIQMEVCCPSGKEIPQCDSESNNILQGTFFYSTIITLVHVFFVLQFVDR